MMRLGRTTLRLIRRTPYRYYAVLQLPLPPCTSCVAALLRDPSRRLASELHSAQAMDEEEGERGEGGEVLDAPNAYDVFLMTRTVRTSGGYRPLRDRTGVALFYAWGPWKMQRSHMWVGAASEAVNTMSITNELDVGSEDVFDKRGEPCWRFGSRQRCTDEENSGGAWLSRSGAVHGPHF